MSRQRSNERDGAKGVLRGGGTYNMSFSPIICLEQAAASYWVGTQMKAVHSASKQVNSLRKRQRTATTCIQPKGFIVDTPGLPNHVDDQQQLPLSEASRQELGSRDVRMKVPMHCGKSKDLLCKASIILAKKPYSTLVK